MTIRVTHSSSTTGSPFPPHSDSESPLPRAPPPHVGSPFKAASQDARVGWGRMPGFPGVVGGRAAAKFWILSSFYTLKLGVGTRSLESLFSYLLPQFNLPSKPTIGS